MVPIHQIILNRAIKYARIIQGREKRLVNFARLQPGRARKKYLAATY